MGGSFRYVECGGCHTLALVDVPSSMDPYYPASYYSFETPDDRAATGVDTALRRGLAHVALASPSVANAAARGGRRFRGDFPLWWPFLAHAGVGFQDAILDFGCGDGHRLRTLRRYGFSRLTGTDPFLPAGVELGAGITTCAPSLADAASTFDLVMFHHSFEHVADPLGVLERVRARLSPKGAIVLRIPLAGSYAWRTYGVDWVQLDAPRHLFLLTPAAVHVLAARAGFAVAATIYDSDSFQFWGSEQYRAGIPLRDGRRRISEPEARELERRARELNRTGDGDQAAFLLFPLARAGTR